MKRREQIWNMDHMSNHLIRGFRSKCECYFSTTLQWILLSLPKQEGYHEIWWGFTQWIKFQGTQPDPHRVRQANMKSWGILPPFRINFSNIIPQAPPLPLRNSSAHKWIQNLCTPCPAMLYTLGHKQNMSARVDNHPGTIGLHNSDSYGNI